MIWNFLKRQGKPGYVAGNKAPSAKAPPPTQLRHPALKDATLVVTHAEICDRHGTGALLGKIFEHERALLVFYSRNIFNQQSRGTVTHHVSHPESELEAAERRVAALLDGHEVKRILCVPFFPDEALSAIAAAKLTGVPLVTYIMDDQNLFFQGITDPLMKMLLERSAMRFAISEALRSGFEEKYALPVWIIPPANSRRWFAPSGFPPPHNQPPKGVIIGNVWSPEIFEQLRGLIKASGLTVDWFGNAGEPFIQLDTAELANEGIMLRGVVPEDRLVKALRQFDYTILPSGNLSGTLAHDWLFRASLPSRLIYMMTTAHLPVVVLGGPETAAGRFVTQLELGVVSPYRSDEFRAAISDVTNPKAVERIRRKAAELAPTFASEPISDWIWRSVELGKPIDDRYEKVFSAFSRKRFDPECLLRNSV
ncbi:MAG: hypothetical protein JO170_23365 [Verrucomicrobia bacterium]|nr:hypothetical protein [Verrucomicrobiota bacterium]